MKIEPRKVFISGPMSGYPNNNKEAFMEAERLLKDAGFSVMNPAWLECDENFSAEDFLAIDMAMLSRCDAIYQLDGWKDSLGAKAEFQSALWAKKSVINHEWLKWYVDANKRRYKKYLEGGDNDIKKPEEYKDGTEIKGSLFRSLL